MTQPPNTPRPGSGGVRGALGRAVGGGKNSSYQQMQAVLQSQEAVNQATTDAMNDMRAATNLMYTVLDRMVVTDRNGTNLAPGYGGPGGGTGGGAASPRPTMGQNQGRYHHGFLSQSATDPYLMNSYGHGVSGLRAGLAARVHGAYGTDSGPSYRREYEVDQQGNRVLAGYTEIHPDGHQIFRAGPDSVSEDELSAANRRATISGLSNAFAMRGAAGMARAIPYVGAAIIGAEVAKQGVTFLSDQRAANAQYQSIYGGSNVSQLGQRAQQYGFQLGNLFGGGLTWDMSQQAFQGVSAMGFQGAQRSNDLSFITQNYMRMGVSVADSLKLIQTASQDLNESLTGLQEGLKNTRNEAIATGQSGNAGTQAFTQTYQRLAQNYAGAGVAQVAGSVAPLTASLGRYGINVDLAQPLSDPNQLAMMAKRNNMTITQFIGAIQAGNMPVVMRGLDYSLARAAEPVISNQRVSQFLDRQARGMHNVMSPDNVAAMAEALLQSHTGFNVQALQAQYQASGYGNLTPQQATMLMIAQDKGQIFNKRQMRNAGVRATNAIGAGIEAVRDATANAAGGSAPSGPLPDDELQHAIHTANPVLDDARRALMGKFGQHSDKPADVIVKDAAGRQRVVSFDVAARDYADQIALGTAVVAGSAGKTIKDILGGEHQRHFVSGRQIVSRLNKSIHGHYDLAGTSPSEGRGTQASDNSDDLSNAGGMSRAAYERWAQDRANKAPVSTVQGRVIIEPSPELKSLLNFSRTGNVDIANTGAANGVPPGVP